MAQASDYGDDKIAGNLHTGVAPRGVAAGPGSDPRHAEATRFVMNVQPGFEFVEAAGALPAEQPGMVPPGTRAVVYQDQAMGIDPRHMYAHAGLLMGYGQQPQLQQSVFPVPHPTSRMAVAPQLPGMFGAGGGAPGQQMMYHIPRLPPGAQLVMIRPTQTLGQPAQPQRLAYVMPAPGQALPPATIAVSRTATSAATGLTVTTAPTASAAAVADCNVLVSAPGETAEPPGALGPSASAPPILASLKRPASVFGEPATAGPATSKRPMLMMAQHPGAPTGFPPGLQIMPPVTVGAPPGVISPNSMQPGLGPAPGSVLAGSASGYPTAYIAPGVPGTGPQIMYHQPAGPFMGGFPMARHGLLDPSMMLPPKRPFCNACRRLLMDRMTMFLLYHPHPALSPNVSSLFASIVRSQVGG